MTLENKKQFLKKNSIVIAALFILIIGSLVSLSLQQSKQDEPSYVIINESGSANETFTGTYNETRANNVLIDSLGFRLNIINGTNNPVKVVDTIQGVNITISDTTGGSGGLTGSGITDFLARWTNSTNLSTGISKDNGTRLYFNTGDVATEGIIALSLGDKICWKSGSSASTSSECIRYDNTTYSGLGDFFIVDNDLAIRDQFGSARLFLDRNATNFSSTIDFQTNSTSNWVLRVPNFGNNNLELRDTQASNVFLNLIQGANRADSGIIRLGFDECISWESSPSGADRCFNIAGSDFKILLSSPTNNQILRYNSTSGQWENEDQSGAVRESLTGHWTRPRTFANIGTAFVDIQADLTNGAGQPVLIDTNTKIDSRLNVQWNKIGTGTQTVQLVRCTTSACSAVDTVLVSMNVVSGNNDSGLIDIPASLENSINWYKLQAKSTVAGDDPVFQGAFVMLK